MDLATRQRTHAVGADLRLELVRSLAMPLGGATALGLAIALIPVRDLLDRPVALLPFAALVITVSLVGGTWPGCVVALVAGLSFDSFLHEPYGVLTLDQWAFWSSTAGLLVAALTAGSTVRRGRGRRL